MFFWNEDSIGWYRKAAEYGDFNKRLAQMLMGSMEPWESICDMGCGLGYLSLELAEHVKHVTAVDIDQGALSVLRENIRLQGRRNIQVMERDYAEMPEGAAWDTLILCFFGRIMEGDNLKRYLDLCRRRLIFIASNSRKSNFSSYPAQRAGKERVSEVEAFLQRKGMAYTLKTAEFEFGQPLDSVAEAEAFTGHYSHKSSADQIKQHVENHLVTLANGQFYMPGPKQFGVFIIEK